ncbi:MAG: DUF2905 domain-containing protein [Candidatus Omnitrophica bacterium]|nr:DUF2905 domain-containing protein [Candidatus Omnitrophota bacterium]
MSKEKLFITGLIVTVFGLILILVSRFKLPFTLFRLPGDIFIKRGNFTFYFPLTTCIVISIVLTLILRLFRD